MFDQPTRVGFPCDEAITRVIPQNVETATVTLIFGNMRRLRYIYDDTADDLYKGKAWYIHLRNPDTCSSYQF
jgi:hypothetical protein